MVLNSLFLFVCESRYLTFLFGKYFHVAKFLDFFFFQNLKDASHRSLNLHKN